MTRAALKHAARMRQERRKFCLHCETRLKGQQRKFCSVLCSTRYFGERRRVLVKDRLSTLYCVKRMTITQVAEQFRCNPSSVWSALRRFGIPCRKYTVCLFCREPGCGKPAFKFRNSTNGRLSGTRCLFHTKVRRALWSKQAMRRRRARIIRERENWCLEQLRLREKI